MRIMGLWMVLSLAAGCCRTVDLTPHLESLVEAERAFSAMTEREGISKGFSAFFNEEAISFRPEPVPARQRYVDNPNIPGVLSWVPIFADAAASGDFGYTTGPWELRRKQGESPVGYGHYVSVWIRKEGQWSVIFDAGNNYAGPDTTVQELFFGETSRIIPAGTRESAADLYEMDRKFESLASGEMNSIFKIAMDSFWIYPEGSFPTRDRKRIRELLFEERMVSLEPMAARAASSGDLGHTYGTGIQRRSDGSETRMSYLHIWKRNGAGNPWKLALMLHVPIKE